jgi:hypothetical protein
MNFIRPRFNDNIELLKQIDLILQWLHLRKNWWKSYDMQSAKMLWKMRHFNLSTTLFELSVARLPYFVYITIIKLIQSGRL